MPKHYGPHLCPREAEIAELDKPEGLSAGLICLILLFVFQAGFFVGVAVSTAPG